MDISVVIPVRNAESLIDGCLASVVRQDPREIIVVDGNSTDRTLEIVARYPSVRVFSDEGRGVAAARLLGIEATVSRWVALIDADVVLADGDLQALFSEFVREGYVALQAGLLSEAGPRYWGQALVNHHRTGRSKDWFGVVTTIFERKTLLEFSFDPRFTSGEDVDLRWRLQAAGARNGVSRSTVVRHRFADTWQFAKGQFLADGHGLGRMIRMHGLRAKLLSGLPLAAGIRGIVLSLVRGQPRWVPYYIAYTAYNYLGLLSEMRGSKRSGAISNASPA